ATTEACHSHEDINRSFHTKSSTKFLVGWIGVTPSAPSDNPSGTAGSDGADGGFPVGCEKFSRSRRPFQPRCALPVASRTSCLTVNPQVRVTASPIRSPNFLRVWAVQPR